MTMNYKDDYGTTAWMPHTDRANVPAYNSQETSLKMPEYGRFVQDMVDYALTIDDKAERQAYAESIVSVMLGLNPKLKDVPDYRHKIWDHLARISDYKLDIDYPFPVTRHDEKPRPLPLTYPKGYIRFRHYGRLIETAMKQLAETPEGPERDDLVRLIANRMKRNLADWKGDGVEDSKVARDIAYYTSGEVEPDFDNSPLMRITDNKFRTRKNKGLS